MMAAESSRGASAFRPSTTTSTSPPLESGSSHGQSIGIGFPSRRDVTGQGQSGWKYQRPGPAPLATTGTGTGLQKSDNDLTNPSASSRWSAKGKAPVEGWNFKKEGIGGNIAGGGGGGGGISGQQNGRGQWQGHQVSHSYSGSVAQKAKLASAYQDLGKELSSTKVKVVGNYTLGRVIGEGSHGKVRMGIHRLTRTRCAIKQMPKSLFIDESLGMVTREIHHHRALHHPHICQLYEIIATESHVWLVSELCAGGELFDYLLEKGRLQEGEARRVFGQLCLAVGYIHSRGIVHRDLKLENVLLDERCNVKLADFGFGREFESRKLMETFCGTLGYVAPEMLKGVKYYGEDVDIWSLGVILYTLVHGSLPFDDENDRDDVIKAKILKCEYSWSDWLSEDLRSLIDGILRLNPRERLTLRQIISSSWFTRPFPTSPTQETITLPAGHGGHPSEIDHPPVIPEESISGDSTSSRQGASSPEHSPTGLGRGVDIRSSGQFHPSEDSVAESDTSASSWYSAAHNISDVALGGGSQNSGATTPITSDDGAGGSDGLTELPSGLSSPAGQSKLGHHSNESQDTIRKDFGGSDLATPRAPSARTPSLPTHVESPPPIEENEDYRFVESASLERTASAGSYSLNGVPIHSRTPSRTKRRSVGSTISERVAPLDLPPVFDYLSMLTAPVPSPFTSSGEKQLLDSLVLLGFDTGQIVHSVDTNACDPSGALWWMLRAKADATKVEKGVEERTSMTSEEGFFRPSEDSPNLNEDPSPTVERPGFDFSDEAVLDDTKRSRAVSHDPRTINIMSQESLISPSASAPSLPSTLNNSALAAPPQLASRRSADQTLIGKRSSTKLGVEVDGSRDPKGKRADRSRSSSVSMLQRATSALGSGLQLKKSDNEVKKEETSQVEDVRSTTNLPLAALFSRKGSNSGLSAAEQRLVEKPSQDRLKEEFPRSSPASPKRGEPQTANDAPRKAALSLESSAASTSSVPSDSKVSPSTSPDISSVTSHDTYETLAGSPDEGRTAKTPVKPRGRGGSLFANFRLWFNEDRRKRVQRQGSLSQPSTDSLASRGKAAGRRIPRDPTGSPLKRPPLGSRRSSNGSAMASRRSSMNSVHRLHGEGVARARRQSDSSRASRGSRSGVRTPPSETSRPPSADGSAGPGRRTHVRSGSASSLASRKSGLHGTPPVASYRRTPSTTQVRRISAPHSRGHSRKDSTSSSIRTSSSSISDLCEEQGENNPAAAHATIEEESESTAEDLSGTEKERERALRKLSGESSRLDPSDPFASRDNRDPTRHNPHSIFVAHKSRNIFGSPAATGATSSWGRYISQTSNSGRQNLRDVFAKSSDSEWVDEDDEEMMFGGGFGQQPVRSQSPNPPHLFGEDSAVSDNDLSPTEVPGGGSAILGEGRYAGVGGTSGRQDMAAGGGGTWRSLGNQRPGGTLRGPVIEEEEEEEDA